MLFTVVIPTYRRPQDLVRCLDGLKQQRRLPDRVFVIVRDSDLATWEFLAEYPLDSLPLKALTVNETGVVAAMNKGLDAAEGDVIAFTDDDAIPHQDWLEKIESHFLSDNRIGGVGGKDIMYHGTQLVTGERKTVGKLQWFGRVIGNHHLGVGKVREVDVLKGVNMSFRHAAIKEMYFDRRMQGTGAQVHFELAFCLLLKKAGWKLIYDPELKVDHYRARRFDEDQRDTFNDIALTNAVHNETLALLNYLSPLRKIIFLVWINLVGNRDSRGFVQWLRFFPSEGLLAGRKWLACIKGRWLGWRTWRSSS